MTISAVVKPLIFVLSDLMVSGSDIVIATHPDGSDFYGAATAVSDSLLVVGAPKEDSSARVINGEASNNSAWNSGAAYVYRRRGAGWDIEAYLKPDNAQSNQHFGEAVAVAAAVDLIVVGAPFESSNGSSSSDTSAPRAGAAYVFERNRQNVWVQTAYLKPKFPDAHDYFGQSISISGNGSTIVIGAPGNDSASAMVNSNEADNSLMQAGAAYAFVKRSGVWQQVSFLKPANAGFKDAFGHSVDVNFDGGRIVVGAQNESSASSDPNDNKCAYCGAAYVFDRMGSNHFRRRQTAYLKPIMPIIYQQFGRDVTINNQGTTIAIGAPRDWKRYFGPAEDEPLPRAYVFQDNYGKWKQTQTLLPENIQYYDAFGHSVDFSPSGKYLIVGAPNDRNSGKGINNSDDNSISHDYSGAAYIYKTDGLSFVQTHYLKGRGSDPFDIAGFSVSISGSQVAVGIPGKDSKNNGIVDLNTAITKTTDKRLINAGAAMLFDLPTDLGLIPD